MAIGDALAQVWALPSSEIWTALEITGTATDLRVAAACAIRSDDKPEAIAGGTPLNGRHRAGLDALSLLSVQRLSVAPVPLGAGLPERLQWPVEAGRAHALTGT
jgi:hypothetical protein